MGFPAAYVPLVQAVLPPPERREWEGPGLPSALNSLTVSESLRTRKSIFLKWCRHGVKCWRHPSYLDDFLLPKGGAGKGRREVTEGESQERKGDKCLGGSCLDLFK